MNNLTEFGLSEKQSKIYLSALKLGKASVQQLAREARIERTNVYDAVEALIEKGLMSVVVENKKRYFVAEEPSVLGRMLEERKSKFEAMLPRLELLRRTADVAPRVAFYPGVEGYRTVYEATLKSKEKKLFGIFSVRDMRDVLGQNVVDRIVEKRVARGIALRVIRSRERELPSVRYPTSTGQLRDVRFAPTGMDFPITTYVYDNKVAILSSKQETFGLIIESADIAQAHRYYFEALWQISEPVK